MRETFKSSSMRHGSTAKGSYDARHETRAEVKSASRKGRRLADKIAVEKGLQD